MTQYDPDSLFGHGIRISELEKSIKALGGFSNEHAYEIVNLEEVLRELMKALRIRTGISYETYNELLAKLDGVDKVDHFKEWQKNIKVHNLDDIPEKEKKEFVSVLVRETFPEFYNEDGTEKDSGGEDSVEDAKIVEASKTEVGCALTDSKPPEPKSKHMWSHLTEVSYCDICGEFAHQVGYNSECANDIYPDENYEEWLELVKETLKEKGYNIVKNEDLQKLFDWINRFPVDWDKFVKLKGEYEID